MVSYAKLLNGHAATPSAFQMDDASTAEEDSVMDVQTTSEKSTPPKGKKHPQRQLAVYWRASIETPPKDLACRLLLYHAQTAQAQLIFTCPVSQEHLVTALYGCKCMCQLRRTA